MLFTLLSNMNNLHLFSFDSHILNMTEVTQSVTYCTNHLSMTVTLL